MMKDPQEVVQLWGQALNDVLIALLDQFYQSQAPKIFELTRLVANLHEENSFILSYFNKLKS